MLKKGRGLDAATTGLVWSGLPTMRLSSAPDMMSTGPGLMHMRRTDLLKLQRPHHFPISEQLSFGFGIGSSVYGKPRRLL
jgi:hypothetical protein